MTELVEPRVIIDRFSLLSLLEERVITTVNGQVVRASEQYLVLPIEYGSLYQLALRARVGDGYQCSGRIHDVATLMARPCPCMDGWVPVLSPSFLRSVLPVPIVVTQPPPESFGLRLRLLSSIPALSIPEATLIAGIVWDPHPLVACQRDLSKTAQGLLADAGVILLDLHHQCPHA